MKNPSLQEMYGRLRNQKCGESIEVIGKITLSGESALRTFGEPNYSEFSYSGLLTITREFDENSSSHVKYTIYGSILQDPKKPEFSATLRGVRDWKRKVSALEAEISNLGRPNHLGEVTICPSNSTLRLEVAEPKDYSNPDKWI